MRFLLIHIIIVISLSATFAQWDEPIIIDRPETRTGRFIEVSKDSTWIVASGKCDNDSSDCAEVILLKNGLEVWHKRLPWLDITHSGIFISNDKITIVGNNNPEQEDFLIYEMSAITGDSIRTVVVDSDELELQGMFHLASEKKDNRIWVGGSARLADTAYSVIYVVDEFSGITDSLIIPDRNDNDCDLLDMDTDSSGNIVVFLEQRTNAGEEIRSIFKYNNDFEKSWQYVSESDPDNRTIPKGSVLNSNSIVYVSGHPEGNSDLLSLRSINSEGEIEWQYDYENQIGHNRGVYQVISANDGNFFVLGEYGNQILEPKIYFSPYLAKFNKSGELLWERVYVSINNLEFVNSGILLNLTEAEDGYIYVTGRINDTDGNILIMRLDQEGCLDDDCGLLSDITSTDFITMTPMAIEIYPNPASEQLHIRTEIDMARYALYQSNGQLVSSAPVNRDGKWDITHVPAGRYLLVVSSTDGRNHAQWVEIVE